MAEGNADEACGAARHVLASTRELGSYLVVQQLEGLKQLLDPYRHSPEVASFLDELGGELRQRRWLKHWISPAGPAIGPT